MTRLFNISRILLFCLLFTATAPAQSTISSPDKTLQVAVSLSVTGQPTYNVNRKGVTVLQSSPLGIITATSDFSGHLKLLSDTVEARVKDSYSSLNAKKSKPVYIANQKIFHFQNGQGKLMDIIFQVSNDGVAFRYAFDGNNGEAFEIKEEKTAYRLPPNSSGFLQPKAEAQTGWEHTNPSYEEAYLQDIPVGAASPTKAGWVYPAIFKTGENWLLFTEAGMTGDYAATHLENDSGSNLYRVAFPDPREVFTNKALIADASLPWQSPWRIICIGPLKTIVESTLGTDLAPPPTKKDWAFVQPGKAAWSWINSKDDFIVYDEQVKYVDFAAQMHWQYCLVDADWDRKIGYEKIKQLVDYAKTKNVGILLWYNSAGGWNTVKYTPKGLLLTHEDRVKEFARLQQMGIKGVKIDFFNGDGQSMMQYYNDILADAAQFKLLVNFHGATLPRGWARSWPNLMTMEAVKGFEMITFGQEAADREASHCAMLPFTRNAFDPMDFTPMNLYKIQTKVQRKTSSAFELATSVLFLSGIQHYAESPEGMAHVPEFVQAFLRNLPNHWDDVKFIDGYPGKQVVIARKSGNHWYIAGINGQETTKTILMQLPWLANKTATLITDGNEPLSFQQQKITLPASGQHEIIMGPNAGFVMLF